MRLSNYLHNLVTWIANLKGNDNTKINIIKSKILRVFPIQFN